MIRTRIMHFSLLTLSLLALLGAQPCNARLSRIQPSQIRLPANERLSAENLAELNSLLASLSGNIGQTKIEVSVISRVYQLGAGRAPFWTDNQGISADGMTRIKALAELIGQHGLRATYYYGQDITSRKAQKTPRALAELEVLLTQAYFNFLADLKTGRTQPSDSRQNLEDIEIKKNAQPVASDVFPSLLTEDEMLNKIEQLRPQSVAYVALVGSLARLRFGRAHGGWSVLTADRPTLRPGDSHPSIIGIRQRLVDLGFLPSSMRAQTAPVFDQELQQAVLRFQAHHFLSSDAVIGSATYKVLDVPLERVIEQVRANMEKWRFFPRPALAGETNPRPLPARFLFVDIGRQQLDLMADNQLIFRKRVVVGSELNGTPTMSDKITSITINPYWYPPTSIVINETIPAMLANRDYLRGLGMRVLQGSNELDSETVNSIDWKQYSLNRPPPYVFRQDSGKYSALGNVKFHLTNAHAIYLHDTGNREAFKQNRRFLSHGCIRVEKPAELAVWLLRNHGLTTESQSVNEQEMESWFENPEIRAESIKIAPLPVFILGTTLSNFPAEPGTDPNGFLVLGPDVYGQDARIINAMEGRVDPAAGASRNR